MKSSMKYIQEMNRKNQEAKKNQKMEEQANDAQEEEDDYDDYDVSAYNAVNNEETIAKIALGFAMNKTNKRKLISELIPGLQPQQIGDIATVITGGLSNDDIYVTPKSWSVTPDEKLRPNSQMFIQMIGDQIANQKQKMGQQEFRDDSQSLMQAQQKEKKKDKKNQSSTDPLNALKKTSFVQGIDFIEELYNNPLKKPINKKGLISQKPAPPTKMKGDFNKKFQKAAYNLALAQNRPVPTASLYEILRANRKEKQSPIWRALPVGVAQYSNGQWRFIKSRFGPKQPKPYNQGKVHRMVQRAGTPVQAAKALTPMMSFVNDKLVGMGYATMGPVSQKGLPFYVGRWADPKTGKVHAFLKPSYVFDKFNYNSSLTHALLQSAYKWNQYVRSQQHIMNLIKQGKQWDVHVTQLAKRNSIPQRHKQQLKSLIKSIQTNNSKIYTYGTAAQKTQLIAALNSFNYKSVADIIIAIANQQLKQPANKIPIGDYMALKSAKQFVTRPAFYSALTEAMVGQDPVMNRRQLKQRVTKTDAYKKYLADNTISSYISQRQRGSKVLRLTQADIKKFKNSAGSYDVPVRRVKNNTFADAKQNTKDLYDDIETAQQDSSPFY